MALQPLQLQYFGIPAITIPSRIISRRGPPDAVCQPLANRLWKRLVIPATGKVSAGFRRFLKRHPSEANSG